ncbi:MAG: DUF4384 domain-containing protein [Methylovulum sp.]|nr:DUF4384 domain-containing protein [Methylovulum sp.]
MKTRIKRYFLLNSSLVIMLVGLATCQTFASDVASAKVLFIDDGTSIPYSNDPILQNQSPQRLIGSKKPQATKHPVASNARPISYAGLQYWIDLVDEEGKIKESVTTRHAFHSGDRIKLRIKSKTEGYLYVLDQYDKETIPLYPAEGEPSGLIQPKMTYTIPAERSFRFDNKTGIEKVTILLTKYPLPMALPYSANKPSENFIRPSNYVACTDNGIGSKGMYSEEISSRFDCMRSNYGAGSKGMISEDDSSSQEPASYTVLPADALDKGQVIFVDFYLSHS